MPTVCIVFGCKNRHLRNSGFTFHRFPKDNVRRKQWLVAVKREYWTPTDRSSICSAHFKSSCFDRTGQTVRLKENAIPTIFDFPAHLQKCMNKKDESSSRHTPGRKRVLPARFRDSSENENTSLRKKKREGYIKTSRSNSPVTVKESNGKGKESIYLQQPGGSWCLLEVCVDKDQSKKDDVPTESEKELYFVGGKQSTAHEEVKHSEERKKLKSVMIEKNKLNKEVMALRRKLRNVTKGLERFLNSDQIEALMDVEGNSEQTWSRETITRARQIQLICGCGGYEFLSDNGYPLPSSEHLEVDESISP